MKNNLNPAVIRNTHKGRKKKTNPWILVRKKGMTSKGKSQESLQQDRQKNYHPKKKKVHRLRTIKSEAKDH